MQRTKEGCSKWLGSGFVNDLAGDFVALARRMYPEIAIEELQNRMINASNTEKRLAVISDLVTESSMVGVVEGKEARIFGVDRACVAENNYQVVTHQGEKIALETMEATVFLGIPDGKSANTGISRRSEKMMVLRSQDPDLEFSCLYRFNSGKLSVLRRSAESAGALVLVWEGQAAEFDEDPKNKDIGEKLKRILDSIEIEVRH